MSKTTILILSVAAILYVCSFFFPAITAGNSMTALGILMIGWAGAFVLILGWYANPLVLLAVILTFTKDRAAALALSALAVIVGLQSILLQGKMITCIDTDCPFGTLGKGYYIWMGSLLLVFLACCIEFVRAYRAGVAPRFKWWFFIIIAVALIVCIIAGLKPYSMGD